MFFDIIVTYKIRRKIMSAILDNEIQKIIKLSEQVGNKLSKEKAFDFLICSLFCYNSIDYQKNWYNIINQNITDGVSDGGIDFIYYDDENSKVIIGQNKYSNKISVNDAVAEIEKLDSTIQNFYKMQTSNYSTSLKQKVLEVLDRLTDDNEGNIDYIFTSLSSFNTGKVISRVEGRAQYSDLIFNNLTDIEKTINDLKTELKVVPEYKFKIDTPKNYLHYQSNSTEGIIVNVSAGSLKEAFDRYESNGLFNLNIRRYIKSKNVDEAIKTTIKKDRDDFWFKNNGLTIACSDYNLDGNTVNVYDFSIVNGGQTTTLIAKNYESDDLDFYVMCKIIKSNEKLDENNSMSFYNEIAEATNSQKPIQPRDLKSNSPEMIKLKQLLLDRDFFLEIKRGITAPRKYSDKKIKNDDLAQLYFSFVLQRPGTARSNKASLFANNAHYRKVFLQKYDKEPNRIDFLVDLIDLSKRVDKIIQNFKNGTDDRMTADEVNILSNGKLAIFALFGFIYSLANKDIETSAHSNISDNFEFGSFISNYHGDDIDKLITDLVLELTQAITDYYKTEFDAGKVTSISNFLKTDKKYSETILDRYVAHLKQRKNEEELISYYGNLFKRN